MINPFEDFKASYLVLVNGENQHSLWPVSINIPPGWSQVYGPELRDACLKYIEESWTDMRPASLVVAMSSNSPAKPPSGQG